MKRTAEQQPKRPPLNQAERSAWVEQLADRHGRMVFGVAWRVLGCVEDAEDVLQNVFLKVLKAGPFDDSIHEWGAYLRVMATRMAIDALRRRRHGVHLDPEMLDEMPGDDEATPREEAERNQRLEMLRKGLAALPAQDAELFTLRHFEEMSYEAIAERYGIPVNRVGVRLHRVRKRLIEAMAPLLGPAAVKETIHD